MTVSRLKSVKLPGQVLHLATSDASSPILITTYARLRGNDVCAVDLAGKVLWQKRVDGHSLPARPSDTGTAWIAHGGVNGIAVSELDSAGDFLQTIGLECDPTEWLAAFVLLPDGIMALWLPRSRVTPALLYARLARHDPYGRARWSSPLPLRTLSVPGMTVTVVKPGDARPAPPLASLALEAASRDPLLVSGSRVAATVADGRSGTAVTFFVDTDTGQLIGATEPRPSWQKAIVGPGEFLIGFHGDGEFTTEHYDATGAVLRKWPTHAQMLIDTEGMISGPEALYVLESESARAPRPYFVRLDPGGNAVQQGPALSGYHTTYPALDCDGTAVFWRDGRLRALDADLEERELFAAGNDDQKVTRRVLLLEDGHVVFALNDELMIFRETGLGPLNEGIWPCADGGLRGNPVAFLQYS
ncbi:hypothetical protein [Mycolicibacterium porcinum]|uniref:hypothetical protein n=1 Tax=Mycolicibacterium porcinum TaxID=39693 RepID=UPI00104266CB|nr:hypothetical protein [Mycolicibacterium porcinum]